MPSLRTEATELAVAFGLIDVNLVSSDFLQVASRFEGTLTEAKYREVQTAIQSDPNLMALVESLWQLGRDLQAKRPDLFPAGANVRWLGPVRLARSVAGAQDLVLGTTAVSIKADSNVVYNLSPYNLFVSLPSGLVSATNTANWFSTTAPAEYEALFQALGKCTRFLSVADFDKQASAAERAALAQRIQALPPDQDQEFATRYVQMCRRTAEVSAQMFTDALNKSLATPHASGVRDLILRHFMRLDASQYVWGGMEGGRTFAVMVPSITEWKQAWELVRIDVEPDHAAEQSKVMFRLVIKKRGTTNPVEVRYHAEIRWSHGRFSGNPEAKLYKDFKDWTTVPGFLAII